MNAESSKNRFVFESFGLNKETKKAHFSYTIHAKDKDFAFTETLSFPEDMEWQKVPDEALNGMLLAIHLALGTSYWKLYCPTDIQIAEATLSKDQAKFWNKLYTDGMGEFYYNNKLDFRKLVNFSFFAPAVAKAMAGKKASKGKPVGFANELTSHRAKSLLFFGGGKDSWTSAELLKIAKKKFTFFAVVAGKSELLKETLPKGSIVVGREVDPLLLQLSKEGGVYKGHVPISMIWAMIGELAAMLYGFKYVIASNEKSASYGNVKYLGLEVNHQWSKSLEAEKMLQDYTKKFITPSVTYFSLLRPLYEIKIVELFSRLGKKHFGYFTSCNRNFRMEDKKAASKWCGQCPKCAFVFLMLAVYLPKKKLVSIFQKNMLDDATLVPLFRELLGLEKFKPFECVGTIEESRYALSKVIEGEEYAADSVIEAMLEEVDRPRLMLWRARKDLFKVHKDHRIPVEFIKILPK